MSRAEDLRALPDDVTAEEAAEAALRAGPEGEPWSADAIEAYWREWRARRRQRRDDVPDQHASTMQREDGSP